jgi:hypothetical protein
MYVVGGYDGNFPRSDAVFYAQINSDGTLGTWATSSNPIPQAVYGMGFSAYNGYLYVAGGLTMTADIDSVYYAPINSDGSTGAWVTSSNSMPQARANTTSVVHNGYWYLIGGQQANNALDDVLYAPLNADGSVGAWTISSNPLPTSLTYTSAVLYNGYIFTFGGFNTSFTPQDDVYSAPLNIDGSVGSWTASSNSLPVALGGTLASIYNGIVYILGGSDANNSLSQVYYAPLTGFPMPVMSAKSATAASGSSITVDVLAGTTGRPNPSTLRIISGPAHGMASIVTAKIAYTPTAGYTGADSITYEVCSFDDASFCTQATVTFAVLGATTNGVTAPSTGYGAPTHQDSTFKLVIAGAIIMTSIGATLLYRKDRLIKAAHAANR